MNKKPQIIFSRPDMLKLNIAALAKRGVSVKDIAEIAYLQQSKYIKDIPFELCTESVEKILSLRDVFHFVQLGIAIDIAAEKKLLEGPIQDIIEQDLGLFGIDETFALDLSGMYGTIGKTNFGDIDVNKHGLVNRLNEDGKKDGVCHTFLDDIVGAIAATAAVRVAQILTENTVLAQQK